VPSEGHSRHYKRFRLKCSMFQSITTVGREQLFLLSYSNGCWPWPVSDSCFFVILRFRCACSRLLVTRRVCKTVAQHPLDKAGQMPGASGVKGAAPSLTLIFFVYFNISSVRSLRCQAFILLYTDYSWFLWTSYVSTLIIINSSVNSKWAIGPFM